MSELKPIAFITGATSGIGKCFALRFAGMGYRLILTGRRRELLHKLADQLRASYNINVKLYLGDLTDNRFRRQIVTSIQKERSIEVLVNNAGFGLDKAFCKISQSEIEAMIKTHIESTVEFSRAVMPGMMQNRRGAIINVASLGAFIPGITRCLYMSTKSFIHHFSIGLSMEAAAYGIKVQSLCPGMTRTDFHRHKPSEATCEQMKKIRFMEPEVVVDLSLRQLESGRVLCIPGLINNLFYIAARILPIRFLRKLGNFRSDKSSGSQSKPPDITGHPRRKDMRQHSEFTGTGCGEIDSLKFLQRLNPFRGLQNSQEISPEVS